LTLTNSKTHPNLKNAVNFAWVFDSSKMRQCRKHCIVLNVYCSYTFSVWTPANTTMESC